MGCRVFRLAVCAFAQLITALIRPYDAVPECRCQCPPQRGPPDRGLGRDHTLETKMTRFHNFSASTGFAALLAAGIVVLVSADLASAKGGNGGGGGGGGNRSSS